MNNTKQKSGTAGTAAKLRSGAATLRDQADAGIREFCGRLSPDRKIAVIIALGAMLAAVNFYTLFQVIRSIGCEEVRRERIDIALPDIPNTGTRHIKESIPADKAEEDR